MRGEFCLQTAWLLRYSGISGPGAMSLPTGLIRWQNRWFQTKSKWLHWKPPCIL